MTIPMAASGQPAPVSLVEVMTKGYNPNAGSGSSGPVFTPPAPPRALAPGESIAWTTGRTTSTNMSGFYFSGTFTDLTASMAFASGNPLGFNDMFGVWNAFALPASIPFGSIITGVYPVFVVTAYSGVENLKCSGAGGSHTFGTVVGPNYGPDMGSLSGLTLTAEVNDTLPGTSAGLDISLVTVAVIYRAGVAGGVDGNADSQLARGVFFWSEHKAKWPSILTGQVEQFLDWITAPLEIQLFASTQTDTASVTVQNISGNTVERDAMKAFVRQELIGALCMIRLWRGDAEQQLLRFMGTVKDVQIGENSMVLNIEGFGNYSALDAPSYDIDTACPLTFASPACGSTSPTPCDQTYGTCSQINRFAGVLAQWLTETPDQQLAQPAPANNFNPRRPF